VLKLLQWLGGTWFQHRKAKLEEAEKLQQLDLIEEEQIERGLGHVVKKQDRRITDLEREQKEIYKQLAHTREEHARCETRCLYMEQEIRGLTSKIERYRKRNQGRQGDIGSDTFDEGTL
jgi:hypothetical protein